uniref:Uncharacterized protein AlNc14C170G7979 n=1 Tax=Albugo laibachii Nc14 TaxID=890382 RepID=F0WNF2_9STRA|nr:conserved hypothetical protein [Albugo laibachii Nc14]|eukprot:CCA22843.1 conserved hypothetical protein [Albugo laibachii Nc14]
MRSQCDTSMSLPSEVDDAIDDSFYSYNPAIDDCVQSGTVRRSYRKIKLERTESESTKNQFEAVRNEIQDMRNEIQSVRQELLEAIQSTRYDLVKEIIALQGKVTGIGNGLTKIDVKSSPTGTNENHTTANKTAFSESAEDDEIISRFITPERSTIVADCSYKSGFVTERLNTKDSSFSTSVPLDESQLSKPLDKDEFDEMFPCIDCFSDLKSNALKLARGTRVWALDRVKEWIESNFKSENDHILTIIGEGGSGKSTLAGYICQKFDAKLHAYHFCQFDRKSRSSSRDVVLSLVSQFASKNPLYKRQLTCLNLRYILKESNPLVMANKLLIEPLRAIPVSNSTRGFVLFDGIDQCLVENESNDLLDLISHITQRFPSCIGFVVTSKASPAFDAKFKSKSIIHLHERNGKFMNDSRILMENSILNFEPKHTNEACDILMRKSGGNGLYLQFTERALSHPILHGERTFLSLDVLDELPDSVDDIFFTIFEDKFGQGHQRVWKNVKPILEAIVAAAAGSHPLVGERQIKQRFQLGKEEWRMMKRSFTDIICCGTEGYRIITSSLFAWLIVENRSQHFYIDPKAGIKFLL